MTHAERIENSLFKTKTKQFGENAWGARHLAAFLEPQPVEEGVVNLIKAAGTYADYHYARFKSKIGDDGFLGEPWADILYSVRKLLNGECGRLDCGTLDALILDMLKAEGFTEE